MTHRDKTTSSGASSPVSSSASQPPSDQASSPACGIRRGPQTTATVLSVSFRHDLFRGKSIERAGVACKFAGLENQEPLRDKAFQIFLAGGPSAPGDALRLRYLNCAV